MRAEDEEEILNETLPLPFYKQPDWEITPTFFTDFYKFGHIFQYPGDTARILTTWTPRYTHVPDKHYVVNAGLNFFIKRYMIEVFNKRFFARPEADVVDEYEQVCRECLNKKNPSVDHIRALHRLGYLPLKIYALPEGHSVPLNIPPVLMINTHADFFWLPNYFETLFSSVMWAISTSATTAQRFWKLFVKWAKKAGETDLSFVRYMGHDFSMRGMMGPEAAAISGMGHLFAFWGTDTVPAILWAARYYNATLSEAGGSVDATEHSVMCAGGDTPFQEFATFKRLLTEVYPEGITSIVSDTWDLWRVLTDYVPRLADIIHARDGKLVIRPDSGDPVRIITGNPSFIGKDHSYNCSEHPAAVGAMKLLANALGVVERPEVTGLLPLINKGALIYGDGISHERADRILAGIVDKLKMSPYNQVFGIGSYTYQMVTRDTYGWAKKGVNRWTRDGKSIPMFKRPITDDGSKASHRGIPAVYETEMSRPDWPDYYLIQNVTEDQLNNCAYEVVFCDGELKIDPTLETVRRRVQSI